MLSYLYDFKINVAKVSSIQKHKKHRLVFVSIAIIADSYCIVQISTILLINLIINFFIILITSLIPFGGWFLKQKYVVCRFDGSAPSRYLLKMPIYLINIKKWIGRVWLLFRKYRQLFIIHSPEWDYYFWHN